MSGPMRRRWARAGLIAACVVGLVGCGSSTSTRRSSASTAASTSAPASLSFSENTTFTVNELTFHLNWDVTLGPAFTTEGDAPPVLENVAVPVTGSATLTNTNPHYGADANQIPKLSIWAFYKSCVAGEPEVGVTELCGAEIASLASDCSSNTQTSAGEVTWLASDQSTTLIVWPTVWPTGTNPLDPNRATDSPAPPCTEQNPHPAADFTRTAVASSELSKVTAGLSAPPSYWALLGTVVDRKCNESGLRTVIVSQPAGLPACLEPETQKARVTEN